MMLSLCGNPPLVSAVLENNIASVSKLLAIGTDPNIGDDFERRPLHFARTIYMSKLLLEHKADPNVRTFSGNTPLHHAAIRIKNGPDQLLLLLNAGADPDIRNQVGKTALYYASSWTKSILASPPLSYCWSWFLSINRQ